MAIILTSEETQQVQTSAKAERPTYYNAYFKEKVEISKDFEAVIILTTQSQKNSVVEWVNRLKTQNDMINDRDTLLQNMLTAEIVDADAKMKEMASKLEDFNKFRDSFTNSKFAAVPEVGLMLNDLQAVMDELVSTNDRAKHLKVMSTVLGVNLSNNGLTADQRKEIESWGDSFLSY